MYKYTIDGYKMRIDRDKYLNELISKMHNRSRSLDALYFRLMMSANDSFEPLTFFNN